MIAKEGYSIILTVLIIVILSIISRMSILIFFAILIFVFSIYFFRDPKRIIPDFPSLFIAPSDGKVIESNKNRITIFMSIYDIHINRIPYRGIIKDIKFRKGEYSKAYAKKAEKKNEAIITTVESDAGIYTVSQIAGIIARRIINNLKIGERVATGERMGMIRFGSSTSVTLPPGFKPNVTINDVVKAGKTIIANK